MTQETKLSKAQIENIVQADKELEFAFGDSLRTSQLLKDFKLAITKVAQGGTYPKVFLLNVDSKAELFNAKKLMEITLKTYNLTHYLDVNHQTIIVDQDLTDDQYRDLFLASLGLCGL